MTQAQQKAAMISRLVLVFAMHMLGLSLSMVNSGEVPFFKPAAHMRTILPKLDPVGNPAHEGYFDKPVPKILHQIWFGDKGRFNEFRAPSQWKEYCRKFGWEYMLWTEENDGHLKTFMRPKHFRLMEFFRKKTWHWAASDLLRLELLKKYGGVYIDCDMRPSSQNGEYNDLFDLFPDRGFSIAVDPMIWNIGAVAISVANGFMMCPKRHPIINEMVSQYFPNCRAFKKATNTFNPACTGGPFYVSNLLSGSFNVFSLRYVTELDMETCWDKFNVVAGITKASQTKE